MQGTLNNLALKYGTDKSSNHHNYCVVYEKYFQDKPVNLLELGYGGYHYAQRGGESARMWLDYFAQGKVTSIDVYDKTPFKHERFKFFKGSQIDANFLNDVISERGVFDIIIDDASHINELTIKTFEILFPTLKKGGIYVVEDCETSYWEEIATDGTDFKGSRNPYAHEDSSIMNYMKRMTDRLNFDNPFLIQSIHFYKGLIFILK